MHFSLKLSTPIQLFTALLLSAPFLLAKESIYFPTKNEAWETIDPAKAGWDTDKLEELITAVGEQKSSGLLILLNGKILAEKHWPEENYKIDGLRGVRMMLGKTKDGHSIEDVASAQKSISAIIVGIAQQKGLLSINDPVHKHLGKGWSRATPEQEAKITVKHLISMSSGLKDDLTFEAPAGTRWRYNTTAYSHSMHVAAAASGIEPKDLVKKWLFDPLGMNDSEWIFRNGMEDANIKDTNIFGLSTSNRDLARVGLMVLNGGKWAGKTIITDKNYLHDMSHPSQEMNPSYGYLWWLNGQSKVGAGDGANARDGPLILEAPADLFAAQGALQRKLYVVPSMNLVITRLGNQPKTNDFNNQFWKYLMAAAPR
ncbi:MAG: serine hydrolase [Verrucomicrobia bacterium]|nr:serine hydrolase [Verrucomicrobiota bacterium]MDA1066965.1 serine hydrolase [Verrucomicrobiota bacterium]